MAEAVFPYNPVLISMTFTGSDLKLVFRKKSGQESRTYSGVPSAVAYQLLYKKTASDVIGFYSREIKGKYKVTEVKT